MHTQPDGFLVPSNQVHVVVSSMYASQNIVNNLSADALGPVGAQLISTHKMGSSLRATSYILYIHFGFIFSKFFC